MTNIIEKAKARLAEKRGSDYTLYHKSYTDAINHALSHHEKSGLHVDSEDAAHHIGFGPKKPSEGTTNSLTIPATHTSGKKHLLHIQVYNKGGTHPYELNTYSSGMGRHVKEENDYYPREGFPEEGDYGYHPNPGLKPQESDKDQDMDKAYKAATEAEAKKPLNAKKLEVSNKVEEAYGMWKVEFPKQHAGKQVEAGSVHVKAQNTAHAHKVAAKRVGVDHKIFKSKVTKSSILPEETSDPRYSWHWSQRQSSVNVEKNGIDPKETYHVAHYKELSSGNHSGVASTESIKGKDFIKKFNSKKYPSGAFHIDTQKNFITKVVGEEVEELMERGEDDKGYYRSTEDGAGLTRKGAKAMGVKTAVTTPPSKLDPNGKAAKRRKSFCARMGGMKGPMKDEKGRPTRKAMSLRRWNCRTEETQLDEVLGHDNEWGRPELRKKFAAMTPGQESMAADQIPMMDPFSGNAIHEEQLDEISALGAKKRSQFAAKLQKRLADPKSIAKAKKEVAKKKAAEKAQAAEAPKHLVMQLRKATSIGSKVKFHDGSEHHVAPNHVEKFNDRYHSLKSSIEKESLVKRAHKSHADFMRAISEETEMGQPEAPCTCNISPANYPHPSQLSPEPMLGDMNGDNEVNEWDEAAIEADVTNEIENSSWQDLSKYYEEDEDEDEEAEAIDEAITPQGRLKKKFAAMRNKTRRNLAKNMALKRIATPDVIKGRSIRAARRMVYKRILRNRDPSSVSAAEKARIEAQVKRMAPMVSRLSIRLQQSERKRDQARVVNARSKKK